MSLFYKISNTWKQSSIFYKLNSTTWKEAKNIWYKTTSGWKPVWEYSWLAGAWSACSMPCGGGIQTRTVTCKRNDGLNKADIFCNALTSKPAGQQPCNTQACVTYDPSAGECTSTCRTAVMSARRTVNIDNTSGTELIGTFTLGATGGRDIIWEYNADFWDIQINFGFAVKTTSYPTITMVPNLCTRIWRCSGVLCVPGCVGFVPSFLTTCNAITGCSTNDCQTGNCDRKDAYWYYIRFSKNASPVEMRSLIRIPGWMVADGDVVTCYAKIQDVGGYSGNSYYQHGRDVQKYSYACIL